VRRFFSTRHGFFAAASLVCWLAWLVIEPEHRWVPIAIGSLYAVLSLLFFFDDRSGSRR
jgi:hypothetical protein